MNKFKAVGLDYSLKEILIVILSVLILQIVAVLPNSFIALTASDKVYLAAQGVLASLAPILYWILPLFACLIACLMIKRNLHMTGILSGLFSGLYYSLTIIPSGQFNMITFITFPLAFAFMGYIVSFIAKFIIGRKNG